MRHVFFCVVILLLKPIAALPSDGDMDLLKAIQNLGAENASRFLYGSMVLSYEEADANNSRDARDGRCHTFALADCNYRYDGKGRAFYDRRFPLEITKLAMRPISSGSFSSRIDSFQTITDGRLIVREALFALGQQTKLSAGSSVVVGGDVYYTDLEVPLRLGAPRPRKGEIELVISRILDHTEDVVLKDVDVNADYEGRRHARIAITQGGLEAECWVDVERGAICSYTRAVNVGGLVVETFYDSIESVPGHGWLPRLKTVYQSDHRVHRIEIKSYDFETPLEPAAFGLTQVTPMPILHPVTGVQAPFMVPIRLDRLPVSFSQSAAVRPELSAAALRTDAAEIGAKTAQTPAAPPSPLGELATPPGPSWLLIGGLLVGGMAIGLLWWSRHKRTV